MSSVVRRASQSVIVEMLEPGGAIGTVVQKIPLDHGLSLA